MALYHEIVLIYKMMTGKGRIRYSLFYHLSRGARDTQRWSKAASTSTLVPTLVMHFATVGYDGLKVCEQ